MRGRKAQSALEDDEVTRVRAAFAALEKPQVHVGEEKVVADRVVKAEEEGQSGIESRETVVERRVRANVIRRRTSRIEVAPVGSDTKLFMSRSAQEPVVPVETVSAPEPVEEEEVPVVVAPEGEPVPEVVESIVEPAPAPVPAEAESDIAAELTRVAKPLPTPDVVAPAAKPAPAAQPEAPRGARILGRIDLKQTMRIEPAPTPVLRRPPAGAPGSRHR